MASDHELSRDVDIDLGGIFASIWRNKFRLLVASLIVTLLAYAVLQVVEPRYRSEARILIKASDPILTRLGSDSAVVQPALDDPGIASQVQLLQSRTIARRIITDLELTKNPEFDPSLDPSAFKRLLGLIGLGGDSRAVTAEERAVEAYYDRLKVFQADRARVVVVRFWSHDPKLAAEIPNRITAAYLATQEELKRGARPDELKKLEPEMKDLRAKLMKAEAAVADFRSSSDLLQGRNNNSLATQELSELSTELSRLRAQLSQAEANAAAVSRALDSGSLDSASSVLQSPLIQRLQERQANLNSQLAEVSTTLLSGHPRVQRLRSQIAALSNQIAGEARKIQRSLQDEAEVARQREQDLIQRRNQLKSEAGRVGRAQVELRSLEREADAQRQLLNTYLLRFEEAKSRQSRQFLPADAFVFSAAQEQSQAYFPKKLPILAGTFFGTFLLGSMFTLAGAVLSGGGRQVQQNPYQPVYKEAVAAPAENGADIDETADTDQYSEVDAPSVAPSMDNLTEPVEQTAAQTGSVVLTAKSLLMLGSARVAIISPEAPANAEGTTIFARYLASLGASVIVLDMTGNSSSTRQMLGTTEKTGVRDLIAGISGFADAIHADKASSAHIMPSGSATAAPGSGGADQLRNVVEALEQTYDFLVIDCGAVDVSSLSHVSNAATVNILNLSDKTGDVARLTSEMLVHAGFRAPLVIQATQEECKHMGMVAA